MRTGPFSEPSVVTLINRYFIPFHMDNDDWKEERYGIKPGEENAYIVLETPDSEGSDGEVLVLKKLRQVLEPKNTRQEILAFLDRHPELHQPWPELARLQDDTSHQARLRKAELLLEEGDTEQALALLQVSGLPKDALLLEAHAHRMMEQYDKAQALLDSLSDTAPERLSVDIAFERIRLAFARGNNEWAATELDQFLRPELPPALAAEAYWMRGWLHHLQGLDERAIDTWQLGLSKYALEKSLFSQKAYFTMIRMNWTLPNNVDQAY